MIKKQKTTYNYQEDLIYSYSEQSFTKLLDIIKLYESDNEEIRYKCVVYFNQYHHNKYFSIVNYQHYLEFIADVFFEDSLKIFNELKNANYFQDGELITSNISGSILAKLYNQITFDKRFNGWFKEHYQNNIELLKFKLDIFKSLDQNNIVDFNRKKNRWYSFSIEAMLECRPNIKFEVDTLNKIVNNKKIEPKFYMNKDDDMDDSTDDESLEDESVEYIEITNNNNNNKIYNFSDLVIHDILLNYKNQLKKNSVHKSLLSLALVSKQFFKVITNLINNNNLEWPRNAIKYIRPSNIPQFSLINQPPLSLEYLSIKHIPYRNYSKEDLELFFSRVESISMGRLDNLQDNHFKYYRGVRNLGPGIIEDHLILPPPMKSLRNISIKSFIVSPSYTKLIDNILIHSSADHGGVGINNFLLEIEEKSNSLSFLETLFKYHFNSLKYIKIILFSDSLINNILEIILPYSHNPQIENIKIDLFEFFGHDINYFLNNPDGIIEIDEYKLLLNKIHNNNNKLSKNNFP
ncbi:hypothetical protein DICPUDRAFT_79456 [Dictyostelium purpureum]|uniref:Uncharacterized protein n=1 Tax=Dictyostelium purpureum TaxID=5786 RepID=F0ZMM7_DICPU|nr:uncharacterized protein DICPUDRAFT_79456 [Dictyostelium purpureum]EGC34802.1 hypothetical protein DICPUDRAFT_79456 [Dictyostelium purpureum]|eukprot:XP_003288659.1 hypothetical protein DICPUDRAFT_79456 [Dictyostelium purpureum]